MTATVIGPLLGGVFTSEATWRWCFWINLPIGALALVLQVFYLRVPKHIKPTPGTWKEILLHLDIPGFSILLTSLVCFTLAMQWGGLTKAWSNGSVIATLVMFGVLTIAFFVVQSLSGSYASTPFRLLLSRRTFFNCLYAFMWVSTSYSLQGYSRLIYAQQQRRQLPDPLLRSSLPAIHQRPVSHQERSQHLSLRLPIRARRSRQRPVHREEQTFGATSDRKWHDCRHRLCSALLSGR